MGTPDFAAHSLEKLIENGHEVVGVFTREDTPKGRGMKMQFTPVKEVAVSNNIPVFQPKTLKQEGIFEEITKLNPDIIVVVAYGRLLPENILNFPKYGCVNVHGSILPKYRGAAPIQWAVLNGDKVTGITTMLMSKGMDEGDILEISTTEIYENETSLELFERLKLLGAETLVNTISSLKDGKITPIPQNHEDATFAPMLTKEMGNLDFSLPADKILCKIYGLNPWPCAYSTLLGKKIKIFKAQKVDCNEKYDFGTIFDIKDGFFVACGENTAIFITEIQAEGKKRMSVSDFLKGNKVEINTKFERE